MQSPATLIDRDGRPYYVPIHSPGDRFMADSQNPYQAPAADLVATPTTAAEAFTPGMVQALKETKPWVRFLSILGFVMCGLTVLAGVIVTVAGAFAGDEFGGGFGALFGLFYLVLAGLWILPLIHLHKFANAIALAVQGAGAPSIEAALVRQRSFWRTVGIMTLVFMGLYFIAIFVVVIAGVVGTMSNM
jgi:hypothetical protein